MVTFIDRYEAGKQLAKKITNLSGKCTVTGIARGGIAVAYQVSASIGLPLTTIIVKKIGHPADEEFAIGAVAEGPEPYVYKGEYALSVEPAIFEAFAAEKKKEVNSVRRILGQENSVFYKNWDCVILVDDGVATGSSMIGAIRSLKLNVSKNIIAAAPVFSEEAYVAVRSEGVSIAYVIIPFDFEAVSEFYRDFSEITYADVLEIIRKAYANNGK
ncbi:hypothetical protein [Thermoplasma volcanium GSS1]|uniref:Phosphoribosyltransferase domain-containing protein n=1 Tax=Thermoplasma volcanium (strain ATCC 51530 / DSM 4299 / JCM 9571 / NBRC 15438 / GSS1) TaxID=273116 RepID=Q978M1_THEVO|nr:phosphoribosyltransferase [Thermoplasma volcanium]BAB60536.1 hypothetical protein [Thermoplasma volcanium GSS1]